MKKTLLFLTLVFASCLAVSAQTVKSVKLSAADGVLTVASSAPSSVQVDAVSPLAETSTGTIKYSEWDGLEDGQPTGSCGAYGYGTSYSVKGMTYNLAIKVPSSYAGFTVDTISFLVIVPSYLSDVKAWASSSLPDSADEADVCGSIDTDDLVTYDNGLNNVPMPESYVIPDDGCYVGYSFAVTNVTATYGAYPIIVQYNPSTYGTMYLMCDAYPEDGWFTAEQNLSIVATLTGTVYADAAVFTTSTFGDVTAAADGTGTGTIKIMNMGANTIESVSYTVTDEESGTVGDEVTVSIDALATSATTTLSFEVDGSSDYSAKKKTITLTKVNGTDNAAEGITAATGTVYSLYKVAQRKVVMEEFTATGCTYCTRGMAGIDALVDAYPETFIPIAVHCIGVNYYDPMYCADYQDILDNVAGYPSADVDRVYTATDPYYGDSSDYLGIFDLVEAELAVSPIVDVSVAATWNSDSTEIYVAADTEYLFSGDVDLSLAFVLLGNGLTGDNAVRASYWYQYNYYAGYGSYFTDEPFMYKYTQLSSTITDMTYNHVALIAKDIADGDATTMPATVTAGEVGVSTVTFDVSDGIQCTTTGDELLQDKDQLEVVVLVLNSAGEIVNAACNTIGTAEDYAAGIVATDAAYNATETARYNAAGMQIAQPTRGINIVRMSDGTTRKLLVK